jgi:O-antigen/teichoic acid export membrane protein
MGDGERRLAEGVGDRSSHVHDRQLKTDEATAADESTIDGSRGQVRGSALLVLGRVIALAIGMVTQVIIVRTLTKPEFGAFAYALAIATGTRILLSLGQGRLLSRFMATYEEQRDYARMFGAMFLAVGTIAVTSVLTIGALFLFSDELIGSAVEGDDARRLVLILVLLSPLEALDQVFVSLFAVFSKPRAIFFRKHLLGPGLRLLVVLCLVLVGADVEFLAIGYVLAAVVGIGLYCGLLVQVLRERGLLRELHPRQVVMPFRSVFEFSIPLITGELALLSMTVGGVMVLGWFHSTVEVADFRAVFSAARLNTAITSSFTTLFLPAIARLHERGDTVGVRRTYWHTAAFVAVFSFPVFALTGPMAPLTTGVLFGERYADSAGVLAWLAVGYYTSVVLGFNAYALQVYGRLKFLVVVNVSTALLNIGLCLLLAPPFAAVGVAAANCCALVAQNVVSQWRLRRDLDSRFIDADCRRAYLTIVLCAAGLWVFQVVADPGLVVGAGAVVVGSAIVLVSSRRAIQLVGTFPELARLPVVGRLLEER